MVQALLPPPHHVEPVLPPANSTRTRLLVGRLRLLLCLRFLLDLISTSSASMAAGDITQPLKEHRVEIDTSLPFQSVKAAVSMFGEKADAQKPRPTEKHCPKYAEMHRLKEELACLKCHLAEAEKSKAHTFMEQGVSMQLADDPYRVVEAMQKPTSTEEKHVVWEVELKAAQEQHMTAVAELECTRKELVELKHQLTVLVAEKENALKQAEEALMVAELNARRVEELSHEMSGTNESLVLVKLACIEASKERAALLAANRNGDHHLQSGQPAHGKDVVQNLQIKLAMATQELLRLRQELTIAKETEVSLAIAASEANASLEHTKSELESTRIQATNADEAAISLTSELTTAKQKLEEVVQERATLQTTMEALQADLEAMRKELQEVTSELSKTKCELVAAMASEAKANGAIVGLNQTFQQIKAEAEEAKSQKKRLSEEASKARADADAAKAVMASAVQELEAALHAAEAAKAAEAIALEKYKALSEKTSIANAAAISQEAYEQLKTKVHEAEQLASVRMAAAEARVEAMKVSEVELQKKVKVLNEDIDAMKRSTKQALQRAEMAEAAKLAVEGELRRMRERGQHAKGGEMVSSSQRDHTKMMVNKSQPLMVTYHSQPSESLAQILNMKMPSLAQEARSLSDRSLGQMKKKKHLLPALSSILGKKS